MAGMKKRKHGTLVIKDGSKPDVKVTIDGEFAQGGPVPGGCLDFVMMPVGWCRSDLPSGLSKRASDLGMVAAALVQRDRLAAEVEALRLIVKALEAENRRAWAMVRKLESQ